jgi:hypothetical protein
MSITSVEIRFNSKSASQNIVEALKIAKSHGATYEGKTCVTQLDPADADIEKLLNLVAALKGTKVIINSIHIRYIFPNKFQIWPNFESPTPSTS